MSPSPVTQRPRPLELYSRGAFSWRADRQGLYTVGIGPSATFSRAGAASAVDSTGQPGSFPAGQPRWQVTGGRPGLLMEASEAEEMYWDSVRFLPGALTWMHDFVERGTIGTVGGVLVYRGIAGAASGLRLQIEAAATGYLLRLTDGTQDVMSTVTPAPVAGNEVRLRACVNDAGAVQLHQSIGGAAETSGPLSAGITLPQAYGGDRLYLGSAGGTSLGVGAEHRRSVAVPLFDLTLDQMEGIL